MKTYRLATYNRTSNLSQWYAFHPNDSDGSEYLPYPEEIVRAWFKENSKSLLSPTSLYEDDPCDYWANHEYMISDIDDLYEYAAKHGCAWDHSYTIKGKTYTIDQMARTYNGDICMGDPYGNGDDNTTFWDWIASLHTLGVIDHDEIVLIYKGNRYTGEEKPMTLEDKKQELIKHFEDKPDILTARISEIVFDITDFIHCSKRMDDFINDYSREAWLMVLDWAWEFEYDWEINGRNETEDYFVEIDLYSAKKVKEQMKRRFSVCFTRQGRINIEARDENEARYIAMNNTKEIVWLEPEFDEVVPGD